MNKYPKELKYTETHEWVRLEDDGTAVIGITGYAEEKLGEITAVGLPDVDVGVSAHDEVGGIESVKAMLEICSPLSGEIVEINEDLLDAPGLINADPYGDGWLYRIEVKDMVEYDELLAAEAYVELLDEE